eukprot:TRINITY_DN99366_c0_g1_i1.p1 TRINITY_DN99366_c0_g1~~TRINITY_DN99366_c0_g1_i1.p1  ORF type:complete len:179 (-),score=42.29 TRINITY_DN99366_c0_g1_i1:116-652(-)
MFYHLELFTYLLVKPEYLGPGFHDCLDDLLRQKVEGTVVEGKGLVIAVGECSSLDRGKLHEGTGLIMVPMKYTAVILQLYKNEVVDCEVVEVNKLGFLAEVGPVRVFVSKTNLPDGWSYTEAQQQSAGGASYVSADGALAIRRESAVRVQLVATKHEPDNIMAIGTTNGEFLGPLVRG